MPDIFKIYQPSSGHERSGLRACVECYNRKVKCSIDDGGLPCRHCVQHHVDCRLRTRKRKAASSDNPDDDIHNPPVRHRRHTNEEAHRATAPRLSGASLRAGSRGVEAPLLFMTHREDAAPLVADAVVTTVDRFRNSSYLSRSVILGDDFPGIDHSHVDRALTDQQSANVGHEVLRLQGAFELPELAVRQSLLEAFIERCWTWMPVIDLQSIDIKLVGGQSSLLLVQAIMLVGALMRPDVYSKGEVQAYYLRVKALIQSDHEKDPLNILAALCLIQWYTPAAPKDISTDTPRFWNTYAIGLAQQMGLHRNQPNQVDRPEFRRRIWFTLCARDNLTSAAHGRPRLLDPADSDVPSASLSDFLPGAETRASTFIAYSATTAILGDLCQMLTRKGYASRELASKMFARVQGLLMSLPSSLRLNDAYDFDVAQLHLHILAIIAIFYRPRSVFSLSADNAASVTAANIMFRIFQAIELREQTRYLSSAFAWHLLVAAIPLLSCTRVPALKEDSQHSLDSLEASLRTLGVVRPAAANNLKNVQTIRKAVSAASGTNGASCETDRRSEPAESIESLTAAELLSSYGPTFVEHYHEVAGALGSMNNLSALSALDDDAPTTTSHAYSPLANQGCLSADGPPEGLADPLADFLQADLLTNSFWMREWMDELQPT